MNEFTFLMFAIMTVVACAVTFVIAWDRGYTAGYEDGFHTADDVLDDAVGDDRWAANESQDPRQIIGVNRRGETAAIMERRAS